jgi:hypothetical protein
MNIKSKFLVTTSALVLCGMGVAPAFAGEGGAAGAASFRMDALGNVEDAAVAGSIGKVSAYAGAVNNASLGRLEAFALGTGGTIGFTGVSPYITFVGNDPSLLTPQVNALDADEIEIDATSGEFDID